MDNTGSFSVFCSESEVVIVVVDWVVCIADQINLKPEFFQEDKVISITQFKNVLQSLELTIRDIL